MASVRRADSVASIAHTANAMLEDIPDTAMVFVAVDSNAINHARVELYGPAKLRGGRMATLVHPKSYVAPDAQLGDNVWIAPGTNIGRRGKIGSDVLINAGARIDTQVQIGMHGWIGAGASIGAATELAAHCVLGADVRLGAGLTIGKYCVMTQPGVWTTSLPSGTFIEPGYTTPARMIGAGYTWQARRA
ncbi:hypothetical protein BVER_01313 [Candidatus Burkholderia verschuerenii]|uniref:Mannose-1-phosphate guanyltransferase C-terminal domain-containing protein n=1 Tax=Candidatus Burkholderia verschuerenii TaxID=242163 RepID=A0A0L0MB09_9BURK|nr:hypothetical protein [Candidatus Burkholderia verschuerenii]KND59548.1 hypothetical protein BVER_01313 [Candidatus Burkholderia verschuerenii]